MMRTPVTTLACIAKNLSFHSSPALDPQLSALYPQFSAQWRIAACADNLRHSPRPPVPSKKLVGVAFTVAWHVVQEHDGFKPAKFVHQVNYESPERAVIIARAAISY